MRKRSWRSALLLCAAGCTSDTRDLNEADAKACPAVGCGPALHIEVKGFVFDWWPVGALQDGERYRLLAKLADGHAVSLFDAQVTYEDSVRELDEGCSLKCRVAKPVVASE
jgi:hypothetical protein